MDTEIYCDCSDCGNTRLTGKCLLEEYYYRQTSELLPEKLKRDMQTTLRRRKVDSHLTVLTISSF